MNDKVLYHYGVKGMKWGVRRTQAQLGHKTSSTKKKKTDKVDKAEKVNNVIQNTVPITVAALNTAAMATGVGFITPVVSATGTVVVSASPTVIKRGKEWYDKNIK